MTLDPAAGLEVAKAFCIELVPDFDSKAIENLCVDEVEPAGELPGVLKAIVEFECDVWRDPGRLDGA